MSPNDPQRAAHMRDRALFGLSLDYTIVFILDLDTDAYEIVFTQATNHAQVQDEIDTFTEYVKKYADAFVVPDQREVFCTELGRARIRERFEETDDYHYSFETVPNAADLRYFQAHMVKEYDEEGNFAFLGFRSIDEIIRRERYYRASLEKANRDLERQLDVITQALPGGLKVSYDDPAYSFKYVSVQLAQMLGYETTDELMEASRGSIVGLAYPDDVETAIADALAQYERSNNYATTYRVRCKDGSYKYIEDRGRKFIKPDGTVEHWNLILDQNDLMEKTIALESEKKASQSKSEFLSRMSHDMRTPLNGIIGLLDICSRHPEDRELVDASRAKARVAADHLRSLINDTLELSKLENKDMALYREAFSAPDLVREVIEIAQVRADQEGVKLDCEIGRETARHPNLMGSPLYVKQIVLNLLTNSIKYNHEGGSVLLTLTEEELDDGRVMAEVVIRDNGIGMTDDFLADIYKPFVQADRGPRSTYMGTGLGMAIVKNLIERMSGNIKIRSAVNRGTEVTVRIPFDVAPDPEPAPEPACDEQPACVDIQGARVLLAEDNDLNREISTFILRDEGVEVTEVNDGKEALSCFLDKPAGYFDAILMDIMMPEMNGYEATRAIRSCGKPDAQSVPIIAMTANAFDDDRRKSREAGMDRHLSKPIDRQTLVGAIGELRRR